MKIGDLVKSIYSPGCLGIVQAIPNPYCFEVLWMDTLRTTLCYGNGVVLISEETDIKCP